MRIRRFTVLALATLASCRGAAPPDSQFVTQWIRAARTVDGNSRTTPDAARLTAYAALALYEGYAADPRSGLRSLAGQLNALWKVPLPPDGAPVDGATVAAAAVSIVLDSLRGRPNDSLASAQIARRRGSGISAAMSAQSVAQGRALASVILTWAADDGFTATRGRSWTPPTARAQWTAADAVEPYWGRLRTFALRNGDECMPPAPPGYSESRSSEFWRMGRELMDSVASLTPEKRAAASFWQDASRADGGRVSHWLDLVDHVIRQHRLTADQAVEAYALTSVAIADALVGTWREKYRSLVVRPETYARRVFDARWTPGVATPPSPEYPAEQAVVASAAAQVLVGLFGDSLPVTDSASGAARAFRGFTHARDEAAAAPVYGGVQFVRSAVNGVAQGQCIGERVSGRLRTRFEVQLSGTTARTPSPSR
jgi:hypothetical protein